MGETATNYAVNPEVMRRYMFKKAYPNINPSDHPLDDLLRARQSSPEYDCRLSQKYDDTGMADYSDDGFTWLVRKDESDGKLYIAAAIPYDPRNSNDPTPPVYVTGKYVIDENYSPIAKTDIDGTVYVGYSYKYPNSHMHAITRLTWAVLQRKGSTAFGLAGGLEYGILLSIAETDEAYSRKIEEWFLPKSSENKKRVKQVLSEFLPSHVAALCAAEEDADENKATGQKGASD